MPIPKDLVATSSGNRLFLNPCAVAFLCATQFAGSFQLFGRPPAYMPIGLCNSSANREYSSCTPNEPFTCGQKTNPLRVVQPFGSNKAWTLQLNCAASQRFINPRKMSNFSDDWELKTAKCSS